MTAMTDRHAELDAALERVFAAAREHLAAVKAAEGKADDDAVWQAYVALNNATYEYDELLLDAYGEVTPWEVEAIDPDAELDEEQQEPAEATDPHPYVITVRQRRDYRIPSVTALFHAAELARAGGAEQEEPAARIESVGEAVLELLHSGDGTLAALDLPELEMLNGVIAVGEASNPLDLGAFTDDDVTGPFGLAADERIIGRLDEHPAADAEEEFDDGDEEFEGDEVDVLAEEEPGESREALAESSADEVALAPAGAEPGMTERAGAAANGADDTANR